ncbi:MAG: OB-fold domain-containing protein [Deltaproteobacteria bacterium]|nr:OB-fold domain-containing protein [Deltaproteobacteria bacterium]
MQETIQQAPIIDGLFTWPSESPRLIAGRCKTCKNVFFPLDGPVEHHPDCENHDVEKITLSDKGTLYSYTTHYYQPPVPFRMDPFEPFAVGAVEIDKELYVLGIITGVALDDIKIGSAMELTTGKLYEEDGTEYITWKWQPAAG